MGICQTNDVKSRPAPAHARQHKTGGECQEDLSRLVRCSLEVAFSIRTTGGRKGLDESSPVRSAGLLSSVPFSFALRLTADKSSRTILSLRLTRRGRQPDQAGGNAILDGKQARAGRSQKLPSTLNFA